MINLKSLTLDELEHIAIKEGLEAYRGRQIFQWLWQKGTHDFDLMTNLSKKLRISLKEKFTIQGLKLSQKDIGADGSVKYLFSLIDGKTIESVFMPEADRKSVCVSVQVGCPLNCHFCATGRSGFERNLKAWEIADQVIAIQQDEKVRISHVVFMGMGEPMLNLNEVLNAAEILNSDLGPNISARRMTVSTAGVPEGIVKLANYHLNLKLAVSLNATTDRTRNLLMPVNQKYPIVEVLNAVRYYLRKKNQMVTIEYVMIKGINCHRQDALRLISLVQGLKCKINLIPLNPIPNLDYEPPDDNTIETFREALVHSNKTVTVRKSRGVDIGGGCGQLQSKILSTTSGINSQYLS